MHTHASGEESKEERLLQDTSETPSNTRSKGNAVVATANSRPTRNVLMDVRRFLVRALANASRGRSLHADGRFFLRCPLTTYRMKAEVSYATEHFLPLQGLLWVWCRGYILVDITSLRPTTDGLPTSGRMAAYGSEDGEAAIRRPPCRGHAVPEAATTARCCCCTPGDARPKLHTATHTLHASSEVQLVPSFDGFQHPWTGCRPQLHFEVRAQGVCNPSALPARDSASTHVTSRSTPPPLLCFETCHRALSSTSHVASARQPRDRGTRRDPTCRGRP